MTTKELILNLLVNFYPESMHITAIATQCERAVTSCCLAATELCDEGVLVRKKGNEQTIYIYSLSPDFVSRLTNLKHNKTTFLLTQRLLRQIETMNNMYLSRCDHAS